MNYYFNDDVYTVSREAYNEVEQDLRIANEYVEYWRTQHDNLASEYDELGARVAKLKQQVASKQQNYDELLGEFALLACSHWALESETARQALTIQQHQQQSTAMLNHLADLEGTNKYMAEEIVKVPRWLRRLFGSTL